MLENRPDMESFYHTIKRAIDGGDIGQARLLIDMALRKTPEDPKLHYLKGCTYLKTGHWHKAMNSFMRSRTADGNAAAGEMIDMLDGIMNFYHKDLYNP